MENTISSNIRVKEIAKENKRSLNKEIEYLIDKEIKEYENEYGEIDVTVDD